MPWHPEYRRPAAGQPLRPWFRLFDSRVSYVAPADEWPAIVLGQSEHGTAGVLDQPAYVVTLRFHVQQGTNETELLFAVKNRQRMQASRAGKLSELIQPE